MTWRRWNAARLLLAEEFRFGPASVREAVQEAADEQAFKAAMKNVQR